jgi:hypothetical protein
LRRRAGIDRDDGISDALICSGILAGPATPPRYVAVAARVAFVLRFGCLSIEHRDSDRAQP